MITHHTGPEITAPYINPEHLLSKRLFRYVGWKLLLVHLNQANLIVVPSKYSAQMLVNQRVQAGIRVIGCGVKLDKFRPDPGLDLRAKRQQYGLDADKTLFLYTGRIDCEKNLDTLIHAIVMLDRSDIQLAIAGQGSEETRLQRLVAENGLEDRVVFMGSIAQSVLPDLLNVSDVFVMPGNAESFSIATLEAMACARPVLVANAAALPELVTHQINGYLFQPNNPEDLARRIESLADHSDLCATMGASGLIKAQHYSLVNMVHSYEQAYLSCCQAYNSVARQKNSLSNVANRRIPFARKAGLIMPARLLGILAVVLTLLCSIFLYDQAQARPNLKIADLTRLEVQANQRLLVISPHPDDEILAAGGLMQNVLNNGGRVEVVIVTNGDGEYLSPLLVHPLSAPRAADYVDFGQYRQNETLTALGQIGVNRNGVIFLGYPDGKLGNLWASDWPNATPAIAPYTHKSSSPYQNTYNSQSSYRGNDLFNDLLTILTDFQPDIIIAPHPGDTHSDHSAVSDFTRFAIAAYQAEGDHMNPEVLTYLIHYKGYPIPRGDQTGRVLLPPVALANSGEGWFSYSLSLEERSQKKAALSEYSSQLRSSGSYLRSFVRANEIFYSFPTMEMPVASYESEELLEDDLQTELTFPEPVRERANLLMFSGADLVSWRVARLGSLLCFGAETRSPASKYFSYIIIAKLPDGSNLRISQPDDLIWFADQHFGACFDLDELGNPAAIGFSAESRYKTELVDRTTWRFLKFPD
jgi:LmbE family N-acetylglucosaminyl deacetylase